MSALRETDNDNPFVTVFRMDNKGRSLHYSLHMFNDALRSHARTSYFTALLHKCLSFRFRALNICDWNLKYQFLN